MNAARRADASAPLAPAAHRAEVDVLRTDIARLVGELNATRVRECVLTHEVLRLRARVERLEAAP